MISLIDIALSPPGCHGSDSTVNELELINCARAWTTTTDTRHRENTKPSSWGEKPRAVCNTTKRKKEEKKKKKTKTLHQNRYQKWTKYYFTCMKRSKCSQSPKVGYTQKKKKKKKGNDRIENRRQRSARDNSDLAP